NGLKKRFGQRFLQLDLCVEESIFQNGRDVLSHDPQLFQPGEIERKAGDLMPEKYPANDSATAMERNDHFRAKTVEGATQERPMGEIINMGKIAPPDQMRLRFKPAHQ